MAKGHGLAILLGAKPGGESEQDEDSMGPDSEGGEDKETKTMQLAAMKKFESATTTEAKLTALKQLIKLCGGY